MSDLAVRVADISDEAVGIRSFFLVPESGGPLPTYTPGAHIDVNLKNGFVRQYSLCGDPDDHSCYLIAVKHVPESRGGSEFMHTSVAVGDSLTVSNPRNNFPLDEAATHSVLLAAGIGVTPILSMADRLRAIGASFEFHYFSRGPSDTAFHDRLTEAPYPSGLHFHYALNTEAVTSFLRRLLIKRPDGAQLYMCGPKPFMDTALTSAAAWPSTTVNLEYFSAEPSVALEGEQAFEISLAQTGQTLTVAEDKTIAETLLENGIDVETSCEQGVCGTCITALLEGEADHRDVVMTPGEHSANNRICICVSRAKSSSLVLDL